MRTSCVVLLMLFALGCEVGQPFQAKGVRLHFERLLDSNTVGGPLHNDVSEFTAVSYRREGNQFVLACPCYTGNNEGFAAVELQGVGELLRISLPSGSPYKITITEPNSVTTELEVVSSGGK